MFGYLLIEYNHLLHLLFGISLLCLILFWNRLLLPFLHALNRFLLFLIWIDFYISPLYANISIINTISNLYFNSHTFAFFLCNALHETTLVTVYFWISPSALHGSFSGWLTSQKLLMLIKHCWMLCCDFTFVAWIVYVSRALA